MIDTCFKECFNKRVFNELLFLRGACVSGYVIAAAALDHARPPRPKRCEETRKTQILCLQFKFKAFLFRFPEGHLDVVRASGAATAISSCAWFHDLFRRFRVSRACSIHRLGFKVSAAGRTLNRAEAVVMSSPNRHWQERQGLCRGRASGLYDWPHSCAVGVCSTNSVPCFTPGQRYACTASSHRALRAGPAGPTCGKVLGNQTLKSPEWKYSKNCV